ncbi:hypothetical protein FOZ63_019858, partial [Perkinsus olseni]
WSLHSTGCRNGCQVNDRSAREVLECNIIEPNLPAGITLNFRSLAFMQNFIQDGVLKNHAHVYDITKLRRCISTILQHVQEHGAFLITGWLKCGVAENGTVLEPRAASLAAIIPLCDVPEDLKYRSDDDLGSNPGHDPDAFHEPQLRGRLGLADRSEVHVPPTLRTATSANERSQPSHLPPGLT